MNPLLSLAKHCDLVVSGEGGEKPKDMRRSMRRLRDSSAGDAKGRKGRIEEEQVRSSENEDAQLQRKF